MSKNTKRICLTALGIALYCALSLSMKVPLGVGHIVVDLGYVALAVYAFYMGGISAAAMPVIDLGWAPPRPMSRKTAPRCYIKSSGLTTMNFLMDGALP